MSEDQTRQAKILILVTTGDCRGNEPFLDQLEEKGIAVSPQVIDDRDWRLDMLGRVISKDERDGGVLDMVIFVSKDEYTRLIVAQVSPKVKAVKNLEEAVKILS